MDLLALYSSDESESETNADCINTDTINSDVRTFNIYSEFKQDTNEKCSAIDSVSNKTIDCVNLSDSDSENDVQTLFIKVNPSKTAQKPPTSNTTSKKIDYLNLESSDSDEEPSVFQVDIENLLCNASVLNDVECGPMKPSIDINQTHVTTSAESFLHESKCQLPADNMHCGKRFDDSPDNLPRKHSKSNTEYANIIEPDTCTEEKKCTPKEFIFREDERVMVTYDKKRFCRMPTKIMKEFVAHSSVINSLSWCVPQHSHLLLSASIDCTLKIWDIFAKNPVQCFKSKAGLKAAKWTCKGKQIVAGGFEKKAHVFDVISGKEISQYDVGNYLTSLEIHPKVEDVILCGTKEAVLAFDIRLNIPEPIKTFNSNCEEVLDIAFLGDREFACSTNIVAHDSADRTIMVWDFPSGALFSNQVFLERYTCPSLKVHPSDSSFVAQTNGDYIAFFSTHRPYKIKNKRSMGHKVSGFGIECDISSDGKYLVSGDAMGDLYFYDYGTGTLVNKLTAKSEVATNRLKWHPVFFSTMATAAWDGSVQIWR